MLSISEEQINWSEPGHCLAIDAMLLSWIAESMPEDETDAGMASPKMLVATTVSVISDFDGLMIDFSDGRLCRIGRSGTLAMAQDRSCGVGVQRRTFC